MATRVPPPSKLVMPALIRPSGTPPEAPEALEEGIRELHGAEQGRAGRRKGGRGCRMRVRHLLICSRFHLLARPWKAPEALEECCLPLRHTGPSPGSVTLACYGHQDTHHAKNEGLGVFSAPGTPCRPYVAEGVGPSDSLKLRR